jgi:cell division protein FtsL
MSEPQTSSLPELLAQEHKHRRRRKRSLKSRLKRRIRNFNFKIVLIIMVSVAAVLIMGTLLLTVSARNRVLESQENLERIVSDIQRSTSADLTISDFDRLQASVYDFSRSLTSAKRQTLFLRPFAFLNADLETYLKTVDAAQELTLGAQAMLTGLEPTLRFLVQDEEGELVVLQLSSAERAVELLDLGQGRFLSAEQHLNNAQSQIDKLKLAEVSPDLLLTVDRLIKYNADLREINSLLLDSPELLTVALGLDEEQSYLILSQNSDELRPSGGYISTYGWMTVRNGSIVDYDYSPTTESSPNPPPLSLAEQIKVPDWWIAYGQPIYAAWDGSWYADFPSTAELAAWYYEKGGNPHAPVDGVIGIDIVGFEYLLEGLESVEVPGYGVTVTPENFREVVYDIRAEGEGELPHKRFVSALYKQILNEWQSAEADSVDMRQAVFRALQEKHIMLYFTGDETRLNWALDQLNWSGKQESGDQHDYLMLADANLGSKSNRSVIRQLVYDVEIQPDGKLNSRAAITFDFPARVAEVDPAVKPAHYGSDINYHGILQVFVPANSTLSSSDNQGLAPDVVQTPTHTEFVTRTYLEYNSSIRLQFAYTTPVLVESMGPYRRYKLTIQKQPGMLDEVVSVQVKLPPGVEVIHTSPEVADSYTLEQPILEFRLDLLSDATIEILYAE